jgi:LPXTG-motif cell wall-anchored protein
VTLDNDTITVPATCTTAPGTGDGSGSGGGTVVPGLPNTGETNYSMGVIVSAATLAFTAVVLLIVYLVRKKRMA